MNDFEQLIKIVQEVLQQLKGMTQKATEARDEAKRLVDEGNTILVKLEEREKIVSSKENIICSVEDIDKRNNQIEHDLASLANQKQAFEKECSQRRAILDEQEADYAVRLKDLKERQRSLQVEKDTYKQEILSKFKIAE